jgi:hypothetical protein
MKKYITGFISALLLLGFGACKKKTDGTDSVVGKYRLVKYNNADTLAAYYLFNADNTFAFLSQANDNGHSITRGVYQLDGNTIIMGGTTGVALVFRSGDTLKLLSDASKPDSYSSNTILVSDNSVPAEDTWIEPLSVVTKLPVPDINVTSVGFYAARLWTCDQYEKRIKSFYTTNGAIDADVVTPAEYYGIEGVGGNLWAVEDNSSQLVRINPTNGNVVFTSSAAASDMHVIASDGARIFGYNINNNNLYTYSIAGDNFVTHGLYSDMRDLACQGGYLYGSSYNSIFKLDLNTYKIVKTYRVVGVKGISGLASDGASLWIYVSDDIYEPGYFAKLNLN